MTRIAQYTDRARDRSRRAGLVACVAAVTAAAWAYGWFGLSPVYQSSVLIAARSEAVASAAAQVPIPRAVPDATEDVAFFQRALSDKSLLTETARQELAAGSADEPAQALARLRRAIRAVVRAGRGERPDALELTVDLPEPRDGSDGPTAAERVADRLADAALQRLAAARAEERARRGADVERRLAGLRARRIEPAETAWKHFAETLSAERAAVFDRWFREPAAQAAADAEIDALRAEAARLARLSAESASAADEMAAGLSPSLADEQALWNWSAIPVPALRDRPGPGDRPALRDQPGLRAAADRIAQLRSELPRLEARYTAVHPAVRRAREELESLLHRMQSDWSAAWRAEAAHAAALNARAAGLAAEVERGADEQSRRQAAFVEYRRLRAAADDAAREWQIARRDAEQRLGADRDPAPRWVKAAPASAPRRDEPLRAMAWLITGAALAASSAAAWIAARMLADADRPLADADEARAALGLAVLAVVPLPSQPSAAALFGAEAGA